MLFCLTVTLASAIYPYLCEETCYLLLIISHTIIHGLYLTFSYSGIVKVWTSISLIPSLSAPVLRHLKRSSNAKTETGNKARY